MNISRLRGIGALATAVLCLQPLWAADLAVPPAEPPLIWKTPSGIGRFLSPDDPILQTGPAVVFAAKPDPAFIRNVAASIDKVLTLLAEKSSPTDTQYYEDGIWHCKTQAQPGGWPYCAGPAGMAAVLWKWRQEHPETLDAAAKARQPWLRQTAIDTFERALKDHQKPDGDLSDLGSSHRDFFTIDFITTYLLLKETLDEPTRQRWLSAMTRQVEFMMKSGDLPNPAAPGWKATDGWYTNGNVELSEAEWLYLVWQATGEQKYKELFELQWKHTLSPIRVRWKGYGLFYLQMPTKTDGSDGSAFVTEAGGLPGFDREYAKLQLSLTARLFLKSHDARALRLANLLLNSLLPHLDQNTMILDATYGSRHSTLTPFSSCAPEILAWFGGRSDLLPMLPEHFSKGVLKPIMENAELNNSDPDKYRSCGFDLGALLEADLAR